MMKTFFHVLFASLFLVLSFQGHANIHSADASTPATSSATVLLYHHVADNTPPSTSISPAQFKQHMEYLSQHHTVVPLQQVIEASKNNLPLPENAVAITFDDGYQNIYDNGHPILKSYGFPYTVFINPLEIGTSRIQLTWETIKAMQTEGASFANHTLDHIHMLNKEPDETPKMWLERVWENVVHAETLITQNTGGSLRYLAYPFGEFNRLLAEKVISEGYIGFGQHSGAIGAVSDFGQLPRFAAAGIYANLNTLKVKLNSIAMPVVANSLEDPELTNRQFANAITLTIDASDVRISQATCYFNGTSIPTQVSDTEISFTIEQILPIGRSRVNCTAPSKTQSGRYYWYSQPFFVADELGRYPD